MKLGPLEIRRFAKSEAPSGSSGSDGPSWAAALMAGGPDVNPELTGRAKYEQYHEMRLSDSAVRSALWMEKLPIRAATWDAHEPDNPAPVDRLIADACDVQLGLHGKSGKSGWLDISWDHLQQQLLLFLDWGAMLFEIVWADELVEWRDADGDVHLVRPIARLAPRTPATLESIDVDVKTGRIRQIKQWLPGTAAIPGEKVVHLALEPDPGNPYGLSMLRAMWGPWRIKKSLLINAAIGYDRWLAGLPAVRWPTAGGAKAKREAEEIGRNLRQHERAYVTLEGPKPGPGQEGWELELHKGQIEDVTPFLHFLNYSIGEAALQQFSKLGTTERGARAVGEVLADPYYLAVASVARTLADELQRQVLRRFVDHNFGLEFDTPSLHVSKLRAWDIEGLGRALADLSTAGLEFTDPDTQNDIREMFDFRRLPEGVGIRPTPAPGEGEGLPQGE